MFAKQHPFFAAVIAVVAGVCMVRGVVSVLPSWVVYDVTDELTFIGGAIYWLGFITTVAVVWHALSSGVDETDIS